MVRLPDSAKGLAIATDCAQRYCEADPEEGGRQAVVECWRNITATGAKPLALTNNMNFGNPERPRIMGQFAGAITGMAAAAEALDFPVVSGNVSLYNETDGKAIPPTPVIGGIGVVEDVAKAVGIAPQQAGEVLVLIGETTGWLGSSLYLREIAGRAEGVPPPVDLTTEKRHGALVRDLIAGGLVSACHDLSDGGVLCAVADMALAAGMGASVTMPEGTDLPLHAWAFGEDQARYLLSATDAEPVLQQAAQAGVAAVVVGRMGGDALTLGRRGNHIFVQPPRRA